MREVHIEAATEAHAEDGGIAFGSVQSKTREQVGLRISPARQVQLPVDRVHEAIVVGGLTDTRQRTLQIAESVEDGLALMQMTGRLTWAVPGAGFMADVELPPEVKTVILAPDNDEAGHKAIISAEATMNEIVVKRLLPPSGADWCDVLEARW